MPARTIISLLLITLAVSQAAKVLKLSYFSDDACTTQRASDEYLNRAYLVDGGCQEDGTISSVSSVHCDDTSASYTSYLPDPVDSGETNLDCSTGAGTQTISYSTEDSVDSLSISLDECVEYTGTTWQKYECADAPDITIGQTVGVTQGTGQRMVAVYNSAKGQMPGLILLSQDGTIDDHILKEAERFATLGYSVLAMSVLGDFFQDTADLSGTANSAALAAQIQQGADWLTNCCSNCDDYFQEGSLGLVGWGFGANGVLAYLAHGKPAKAYVAFTPDIAEAQLPEDFENEMDTEGSVLFLSLAYDQIDDLADLEESMNDGDFEWEVNMLAGTKMHFNTMGHSDFDESASATTMIRTLSFLASAMDGFEGTTDPGRTVEGLTETMLNYTYNDGLLPGILVYDPEKANATNPMPAVVVVPEWAGYTDYEIRRQNFFAQQGYVTMSANIYGLPIGEEVPMAERGALVGQYTGNPTEFNARIDAAKTAVMGLDVTTDKVAVIGFCFGGSGVYNQYRFEKEADVFISMHGNMGESRDFDGVDSVSFNGYLLMVSGGEDGGESGSNLVAHLADLSKDDAAMWELMRFSGVQHGFSRWSNTGAYNPRADGRGFEAAADVMAMQYGGTRMSVGAVPDTALTLGEGEGAGACDPPTEEQEGRHDYATCLAACEAKSMTIVCPASNAEYHSIMLKHNWPQESGDFWLRNSADAPTSCTTSNNWADNNPLCRINVRDGGDCTIENKCVCTTVLGDCTVEAEELLGEDMDYPLCEGGGDGGSGLPDNLGCRLAGECAAAKLLALPTSCAEVTAMAGTAQECFSTCCDAWTVSVAGWKAEAGGALDSCDFGVPESCVLYIEDTAVTATAFDSECNTEMSKRVGLLTCLATNPMALGFVTPPAATCANLAVLERPAATCFMQLECCSDWPVAQEFWNARPEYVDGGCTVGSWCPTKLTCEGPSGPCFDSTCTADARLAVTKCIDLIPDPEFTCAGLDAIMPSVADCYAKSGCCGAWEESVSLAGSVVGWQDCTFPACAEIENSVNVELRLPYTSLEAFDETEQGKLVAAVAESSGEPASNIYIRGFELVDAAATRRLLDDHQELKVHVEIITATKEAAEALAASDGLKAAALNTALAAQGLPNLSKDPVTAADVPQIVQTTPADSAAHVLAVSLPAAAAASVLALLAQVWGQ